MEESKKNTKKTEKKVILKGKKRKRMSSGRFNEAETATNSSSASHERSSINTITLNEAFEITKGK